MPAFGTPSGRAIKPMLIELPDDSARLAEMP